MFFGKKFRKFLLKRGVVSQILAYICLFNKYFDVGVVLSYVSFIVLIFV